MKPIEFVMFDGDSSPSTAVSEIYEAIQKDIVINGASQGYEVLSYYYDKKTKRMHLDIKEIEDHEELYD